MEARCQVTSRDLELLLADLAAPVDTLEEAVVEALLAGRSLQHIHSQRQCTFTMGECKRISANRCSNSDKC